MGISERTSMPTPSCPEAPPCTPVLLTECRRRSPLLPHPPSRSRSLLHQRENTPSGSEDPSLLPSPPSSRCGSPSRSTTSAAQPLSTASASKCVILLLTPSQPYRTGQDELPSKGFLCEDINVIPFEIKSIFERKQ